MDEKLVTFVDRCLSIAAERELAYDKPIIIVVKAPTTGETTRIVIAHSEPHGLVLPLNVTWVVSDSDDLAYKKVFKRSSKSTEVPFENTWSELTTYEEVFTPFQYYADEDLPEVDYIVGEVADHLDKTSDDDVHGSTSYTNGRISVLQGSFGAVYQNLNQRIVYNDQRIRELESVSSEGLSETILALELGGLERDAILTDLTDRIVDIENGSSGGGSTGYNSYTKIVSDADTSWVIDHNFGTKGLICQIYDEDFNPVLPSSMQAISDNRLIVLFDVDQAGRAVLIST